MNKNKKEIKFSLGLDIGISSIGWAIIGWNENKKPWLEDFGVRLFNISEEKRTKKSLTKLRRKFRGTRRLLNRWQNRRAELSEYFFAIFPGLERDFDQFPKLTTNQLNLSHSKFFNPYSERELAQKGKIGKVELLKILLHINKNRGYKKFYLNELEEDEEENKEISKKEKKDEDKGKLLLGTTKVEKILQENNYQSVAEMVVKNKLFHNEKSGISFRNHPSYEPADQEKNNPSEDKKYKEIVSLNRQLGKLSKKVEKLATKAAKTPTEIEELSKLDAEKVNLERRIEELKTNWHYWLFPRESLEKEVRQILIEQGKHYLELPKVNEESQEITKIRESRNVIEEIIFRQRDFEDGPGPQDEKKRDLWEKGPKEKEAKKIWKKKNRNISYISFTEATNYCQFYPQEKSGWKSSLLFCLWQFINEFSKIELSDLVEKSEIHKEVLEWLLFDSYWPSKEKSFLEQLKFFLKKWKISFTAKKEGINFEMDFLTTLKSEKEVYLRLLVANKIDKENLLSSLNCLKEENNWFFEIGKVIFANITPERRENELKKLTKQVSFSFPANYWQKFLEYKGERKPANASFNWMLESIKVFLEGKNYPKYAQEKIIANIAEVSKERSDNWMCDLIRNPVVFRTFSQVRKLFRVLAKKYDFEIINIENAKDLAHSEKERKKISEINKKNREINQEAEKIVKGKTDIKKYRLWKEQKNKCIYCQKELKIPDFANLQTDHIIPQGLFPSFNVWNNQVLVCGECNQEKWGNRTAFDYIQSKGKIKEYKKFTLDCYGQNSPKYELLMLGGDDWEEKLGGFIERNLTDTKNISQYLIRYLRNQLPRAKVNPIKGSVTSYFRQQLLRYKVREKWRYSPFYYKEQLRNLTPYHHAIDAIVLAHFKSRGYIQLLQDLTRIDRWKNEVKGQDRGFLETKLFQQKKQELEENFSEIIKKWESPKLSKWWKLSDEYTINALEILKSFKGENIAFSEINMNIVPNLPHILEKRIPLELVVEKKEDHSQEDKIILAVKIKKVLNETEYKSRIEDELEDTEGKCRYPYISYKQDHKLKKKLFAVENPGKTKQGEILERIYKQEKLNLTGEKTLKKSLRIKSLKEIKNLENELNFKIVDNRNKKNSKKSELENNWTLWDSSVYAGFGIKENNDSEWVKNIELIERTKHEKDYKYFIRENDTFYLDDRGFDEREKKSLGIPEEFWKGVLIMDGGNTENNILILGTTRSNQDPEKNKQTKKGEEKDWEISWQPYYKLKNEKLAKQNKISLYRDIIQAKKEKENDEKFCKILQDLEKLINLNETKERDKKKQIKEELEVWGKDRKEIEKELIKECEKIISKEERKTPRKW
ncbi:MAG: type II CRISPR RNA-guided endonuclease Cas9 [Candidatus Moeniiplasma glomeromycotorum]|nr:type II CRISPR RNA-guided endonuclease Cas9 [Candidatus Moeniiplasma glomeromycotorum]MCE8168114.1 type II CRISPR RNA-guided endonuclease Cas9 [Candidatus Moeniiplasma glomeromycotorum]MCE8169956.1 type II CRISPR RNA-guided endonuclease Cas9 [Candidatus Moeniiplasma glomeromycotorum]